MVSSDYFILKSSLAVESVHAKLQVQGLQHFLSDYISTPMTTHMEPTTPPLLSLRHYYNTQEEDHIRVNGATIRDDLGKCGMARGRDN
jgi:hypothetical protein